MILLHETPLLLKLNEIHSQSKLFQIFFSLSHLKLERGQFDFLYILLILSICLGISNIFILVFSSCWYIFYYYIVRELYSAATAVAAVIIYYDFYNNLKQNWIIIVCIWNVL